MQDIIEALALNGMRLASENESGWYVKINTTDYGIITIWATDL